MAGKYRSALGNEIENFLKMRADSNFKTEETERVLRNFDTFLVENGKMSKNLTMDVIDAWIKNIEKGRCSASVRAYSSHLKSFIRYLSRKDVYIPSPDQPIVREQFSVHIFSREEIEKLLCTCDYLYKGKESIQWAKFSVLLRLLYSSGLRISEALNLKKEDFNYSGGTLIIRRSKELKDRIIALNPQMNELLNRYIINVLNTDSIYLFSKEENNSPYSSRWAQLNFRKLAGMIGLKESLKETRSKKGNNVHSLRHTFAVHSIENMIKSNENVDTGMSTLSVYMGHEDIRATEHYYHLADSTSSIVINNMSEYYEGVFPEADE